MTHLDNIKTFSGGFGQYKNDMFGFKKHFFSTDHCFALAGQVK